MGAYLSAPVTEKETSAGGNDRFQWGVSAMQGWRISMEDAHVARLAFGDDQNAAFFGIYDGHGGAQVAKYCARHMPNKLLQTSQFKGGDVKSALKAAYLGIDDELRLRENADELKELAAKASNDTRNGVSSLVANAQEAPAAGASYVGPVAGCTAVVAVVRGNKLFVANAGDSRCVLCRGKETLSLTKDHKPTNPGEEQRINAAGGFVAEGRVNGSLNLSRAIGDMGYKQLSSKPVEEQIVTADPDIEVVDLTPEDRFLILACDGIWDMLTNDEAVKIVDEKLSSGMSPAQVCEALCDTCLAPSTDGVGKGCDNMSAMVVVLNKPVC